MDRIGLASVSWRRQSTTEVARFTIPVEERPRALPEIAASAGLQELVYVATCNRVEVVYVGDESRPPGSYRPLIYAAIAGHAPQPGESERAMTAWVGEGAVEHVFHVAAGLDSAMVGETEIRGQIREALEAVALSSAWSDRGSSGCSKRPPKTARRIHGRYQDRPGQGLVGGGRHTARARERLAETPSPLAVVGVSPMTERCAETLARRRNRDRRVQPLGCEHASRARRPRRRNGTAST